MPGTVNTALWALTRVLKMLPEVQAGNGRVLVGRVVSDKMDKTVVVEVERRVLHPRYRKYVSRSQKYKAHDEENTYKVDDVVVIRESRPLSRTKRWVVIEQR